MDWVNAVVQGVLLGGLYALLATGLSLMFGVMRLVNLAQGDLGNPRRPSCPSSSSRRPASMRSQSLVVVVPLMMVDRVRPPARAPQPDPRAAASCRRSSSRSDWPSSSRTCSLTAFTADSQGLDAGAIETASHPYHRPAGDRLCSRCSRWAWRSASSSASSCCSTGRRSDGPCERPPTTPTAASLVGIDDRHIYAVAMAIALGTVADRRGLPRHPDDIRAVRRTSPADLRVRGRRSSAGSGRSGGRWSAA